MIAVGCGRAESLVTPRGPGRGAPYASTTLVLCSIFGFTYLSHLSPAKPNLYNQRWPFGCALHLILHLTTMSSTVEPFAHPLHPSIASRIDPEYKAFHNEKLLYHMHCHEVPWSPAVRSGPTVPGGSAPVTVGSVKDYSTTSDRKPWLRVFTPEGDAPEGGWPAFIFYHGVRSL